MTKRSVTPLVLNFPNFLSLPLEIYCCRHIFLRALSFLEAVLPLVLISFPSMLSGIWVVVVFYLFACLFVYFRSNLSMSLLSFSLMAVSLGPINKLNSNLSHFIKSVFS